MLIRAFCRPIVDITVAMSGSEAFEFLKAVGLEPGVSFVSDDEIQNVRNVIADSGRHLEEVSPGGPVSNVMFSLAQSLGTYPRDLTLEWCGPYPAIGANIPVDPLPSLRAVGIKTLALPSTTPALPSSFCLVDRETGETMAILVGDRSPFSGYTDATPADMAFLMMSDLPDLLPGLAPTTRLCLMTADISSLDGSIRKALDDAADRTAFVFSSMTELRQLGLLGPEGLTLDLFPHAEVIATDSALPVHIWTSKLGTELQFDVPGESEAECSFLGAGDAYTGAYLGARLLGKPVEASHAAGISEARISSYSLRARTVEPTNLTEIFGAHIERTSPTPDWWLYERVRQTAGTTIVTSFNTGVDTIGGSVSIELGLPWFAVMPAGRRRDAGEEPDWSRTHVFELGTPSYRYCTWTNAFIADGTLLVDIVGGQGSAETRLACECLGRPLLELHPDDAPLSVFEQARDWARQHAIKTVQVAGSRSAGVTGTVLDATHSILRAALLGVAYSFASGLPVTVPQEPVSQAVRVGIPRLAEVSERVFRILCEAGFISDALPDQLVWNVGEERIILAKSRDLVRAVVAGDLEMAIVGEDMVLEHADPRIEVIARAGVHNALLAAIGPAEVRAECGVVAAQYPHVAASFADRSRALVFPVAGAGEGWVSIGSADFLVDTWRTGKTAIANGLRLEEELARTSLTLIGRVGSPRTSQVAPWLFNSLTSPIVDQLP